MPGNTDDAMQRIAARLGLGRQAQLQSVQAYLDGLFPGQCRAVSLNKGTLKVVTVNASVASELRFNHYRQLQQLANSSEDVKLAVTVGQIT